MFSVVHRGPNLSCWAASDGCAEGAEATDCRDSRTGFLIAVDFGTALKRRGVLSGGARALMNLGAVRICSDLRVRRRASSALRMSS